MVRRDLQGYPTLQRKLLDEITRIEEDYKKCGEVPPPPPDWVEAVAAVAKVKTGGSEMVQSDPRGDQALGRQDPRQDARRVPPLLRDAPQDPRGLHAVLALGRQDAERRSTRSSPSCRTARARSTRTWRSTRRSTPRPTRPSTTLTVSAFTQFAIALLVMVVAAGGAFINFKLIALPMSEMVGAGDYLTSTLRTSEVAALVIILVEASMGLFLMEALRITHLFPRIASLSEHLRRRMMWIALVLLVTLAGVEAALALMRDMLIADKQALLQSLATAAPAAAADGWVGRIPTAGQMLLGFILPFALAFIAIPLESLIHSSRTVRRRAARRRWSTASALVLRIAGEHRAAHGAGADHALRRGDRRCRSLVGALGEGSGTALGRAKRRGALSTSTTRRTRCVEQGGHHDRDACLHSLLARRAGRLRRPAQPHPGGVHAGRYLGHLRAGGRQGAGRSSTTCSARCSRGIRSPWRASRAAASARRTSSPRRPSTSGPRRPTRRSARSAIRPTGSSSSVKSSRYTDITGGLLQGAEFLNETGAGTKTIDHLLRHAGGARQGHDARLPDRT